MPKVSVYVPDDLWDRAREANSGLNPSQMVQEGLRGLVSTGKTPSFASNRAALAHGVADRLLHRMAQEARQSYEYGYEHGLKVADRLRWDQLDDLASNEWNPDRWFQDQEYDGGYLVSK